MMSGLTDDISEKLLKEFQLVMPMVPRKPKQGKKEDELKVEYGAALERFYRVAEQERTKHKLGIIGRARVAFGLQQRLLRAGYAAPLVKQVLVAMLTTAFVGGKR